MPRHLGWGSPHQQHRPGRGRTGSSPAEQGLGTLEAEELDMSRHRARAAQPASRVLGCVQSSAGSGVRERILQSPQHGTDLGLLERGRRRPRKRPKGWNPSAVERG